MREDCKQNLSRILGMECWENPGKYLGLPGDWGRSKSNELDWIKERVVSKLQGWREGLLNQASKEVLITSVIQAIPSYAMAMVKFPITFCKKLCSAVARFWWSSGGKEKGIHWNSWRVISGHKMERGLGFKDFTHQNSSLLAKQAWRVIRNPEAFWVKTLKAIYFPNSDFLQVSRKRSESWTWISLIHGRDVIKKSARWSIGNGESVDIRGDCWLASGEMVPLAPEHRLLKVCKLMEPNGNG